MNTFVVELHLVFFPLMKFDYEWKIGMNFVPRYTEYFDGGECVPAIALRLKKVF